MKSSLIKITKIAVALIAFVAAGGLLVGAFHSETATAQITTMSQVCSNATLMGTYAFRVSGEVFVPGSNTIAAYRDGVAMTHFDGMGGLSQKDFIMANGAQSPPTGVFNSEPTGTYTVNADCTGKATIIVPSPCKNSGCNNGEIDLEFVLADGGRVIHTIVKKLTPPGTLTPVYNPTPSPVPANIHSDAEKL